jgi:hypothetical protein
MEKVIKDIYKEFCKETKRSGGILVHKSITEWHEYLAIKLELYYAKNSSDNG